MVRDVYDFFLEDVITRYYEEIKQIDDDQFGGKVLKFDSKRTFFIYHFYEAFRKDIRKMYMTRESKPIDRHKIAANVMISILKAKVIRVNRLIPNLPIELLLANEYVAFYTAINLVEVYNRDVGLVDYTLKFPDTYIENEGDTSYIENICKALYYTKHYKVSDILAYANILFMLEMQTDIKLGIDINEKIELFRGQEN